MGQDGMRGSPVAVSCEGSACRAGAADSRPVRVAARRSRLCPVCRDRLAGELRLLPQLYEECGLLLGGTDQPRERTSGGPLPGMLFNTTASEARSAIFGVLRSWAGVVVDARRAGTARDTVPVLAGFLVRHVDWLAAHPAAADICEEFTGLVRRTRRVIDPEPLSRVAIGECVEAACSGELTAMVRSRQAHRPAEIVCSADPAHQWLGHDWLRLSRRLAREDTRWLSAADIARLWGIAPGSVYRHASQQSWRRRSRSGRTFYHDADVRETLDRPARPA
ncbi:hypothetical protein P8A22_09060 [Streptomyces laculatispora]|uniref:Helix-turn-helix domain-containing protein n=1 Tax=Streptomyces laculatispora TaxID=887464 RepID=A0ABY9I1R1_9ACTN|nr:hypothetical protein [Streptomyces laculatispora]MBO0913767.1 hypothetical protein [Streptomyces laculatispora]WLQ40137.1 hypothetical protein P8A22_09060 [Streptomyces laculatispora]